MRYVALLRAINVGKHNRVTMAALKAALQEVGLENVETYLQSGNVLFDTNLRDEVVIEERFARAFATLGIVSGAYIRSSCDIQRLIEASPFRKSDTVDEHKFVAFLSLPVPEIANLHSLQKGLAIVHAAGREVCFILDPAAAAYTSVRLPKPTTCTVRNWAVTQAIGARLAG